MERNRNSESPRRGHKPSSRDWREDWDGEDSSVPDEPADSEAGGPPSPHLQPGQQTWVEAEEERRRKGEPPRHSLPGEPKLPHELPPGEEEGQPADYGLPPEAAEARRSQGLTGPPKRTGTGFFYRNGDEIPPTHPDHGPMHLIPRQQDGSYAAYYYCSKAELACMENPAPPPRRHRRDGFSPERQEEFCGHLRGTGSITDAAHLTGVSRSTVYNLLSSPDAAAFRAAVEEALKGTDILLEATALDRAINGQEEIVYYKGQRVGVRWKYDNRLLMSLLRARNPLKYAPLSEIEGWLRRRGLEPPPDLEGMLDRLHAAEAEWGRRLPGEGDPAALPPASPAAAGPALEPPAAPALQAPAAAPGGEPLQASNLPTSESEKSLQASTSSTSAAEPPVQASTSSTSAAEPPVQASTSSTSAAEPPGQASISSTSAAEPPGQASISSASQAAADAAWEPGTPIPYRPPPRPRFRPA